MQQSNGYGIILITALLAMVLAIIPLPISIDMYRPDWVLLCVVFWALMLPQRANVGYAFVCGLSLDLLLGSTLGVRALSLSVIAYLVAVNCIRMRGLALWQQALAVGGFAVFGKLMVFWAEFTIHDVQLQAGYFSSILPSLLVWPWLYFLLRKTIRHWKIK